MNFNHLEYAAAAAKYGSISRAAQQLFLSQPYLSSMINSLERELGYKIFNRTSAGLTLTPEGERFLASAQLILLELKKIREIGSQAEEKQLNISSYYSTLVMDKFLQFRASAEKQLADKIKEMGNEEVMQSVMAGESSLGIVFYAEERAKRYQNMAQEMGLSMRELFIPLKLYAIMGENHPLASRESIDFEELGRHPHVSYDDASSMRYLDFLNISRSAKLLEVSDRGSFYDALQSGEYLAVMAFRRNASRRPGLVMVPFSGKDRYLLSSYVTGKNYRLTERERKFLRFLQGA